MCAETRPEHPWVLADTAFKLPVDRSEFPAVDILSPKPLQLENSVVIGPEESNETWSIGNPASHLLILYVFCM